MHSRASSGSRNSYPCTICSRRLTSPYKLREHLMIHTGEKPHACPECKQAFRTKPDLARHRRIHTGEKPYSCPLCGQSFHRSDNLRGHMKVHNKEALRCPTCGDYFVDLNEMQRHMKKHTESKNQHDKSKDKKPEITISVDVQKKQSQDYQHMCDRCGSNFFQKGALAMHLKLVHPEFPAPTSPKVSVTPSPPAPETAYVCLHCGQSFLDLEVLQSHMTSCTNPRTLSTEVPENQTVMDSHENSLDENMNSYSEKNLKLVIDTDSDDSNTDLMDRNRSEESVDSSSPDNNLCKGEGYKNTDKPHVCEDCGERFSWKQDLNRHIIMAHSGNVPYRCTACGKGFIRQDRLVAHIRVHTGKSPHTCDHCHKTFTASSSLKEHLKIHTGEKPHHCHVCGKHFRQKCVLTRHMRNVHKSHPLASQTDPSDQESLVNDSHSTESTEETSIQALDFSAPVLNGTAKDNQLPNNCKKSALTAPEPPSYSPTIVNLLKQLHAEHPSPDLANIGLYSCAACAMPFSSEQKLSSHLLTHHVGRQGSNNISSNCQVPQNGIPKSFQDIFQNAVIKEEPGCLKDNEELLQQPMDCSPSKKFRPNECTEFPVIGTIKEHNEVSLNGVSEPISLTQGIHLIPYQEQMQAPLFHKSPRCVHKCALCGLICPTEEQLAQHTDSHLRADPFFCGLCSETFRNTTDLEEHTKTHSDLIESIENLKDPDLCDSASEDSVVCGVCREQVEEEGELAEHMRMHCPERDGVNFGCLLCDLSFDTPSKVNNHITVNHCPSPSMEHQLRLYGCNFCSKPFKKVHTLVLHLKSHLLDKPHLCDFCGKAFSQKMYLKQHLCTHTGERPYRCSVCDRGFIQKTQLTLHERQHRGETPFKCTQCDKAFTNKSVLKLHLTTHLPLPPHQCLTCGRRFTQAGNLRRHVAMVHRDGDMPEGPVKDEPSDLDDLQPLDLSTAPADRLEGDDGDDLVVMGAYYQQKAATSPPHADSTTPDLPITDINMPAKLSTAPANPTSADLPTLVQLNGDHTIPPLSGAGPVIPALPKADPKNRLPPNNKPTTPVLHDATPPNPTLSTTDTMTFTPTIIDLTIPTSCATLTLHNALRPLKDCKDCVQGFSSPHEVMSHLMTHQTETSHEQQPQ